MFMTSTPFRFHGKTHAIVRIIEIVPIGRSQQNYVGPAVIHNFHEIIDSFEIPWDVDILCLLRLESLSCCVRALFSNKVRRGTLPYRSLPKRLCMLSSTKLPISSGKFLGAHNTGWWVD